MLLTHAVRGDRESFARLEASEMFQTASMLARRDPQAGQWTADLYSLLGEKEKALECLEHAMGRGFINHPFLSKHDRLLDNLRGDELFEKLMDRMKKKWEAFDVAT